MSDASQESSNPILSLIGNVFLFLVPVTLIVMLGVVGISLVGGSMKKDPNEEEKVAAAPPAGAPAEAAPAAVEKAAPAADAPKAAADPAAASAGSIDPAVMALGKITYATCAACHGPDGTGLKAGPALMAPSLVGSEMLLGDPDLSLLVILKGIAKENMDFMGMMAALGAGLDDEKIAAVLTYTRNEWGQCCASRHQRAGCSGTCKVCRRECTGWCKTRRDSEDCRRAQVRVLTFFTPSESRTRDPRRLPQGSRRFCW